jgi:hypothetical protein
MPDTLKAHLVGRTITHVRPLTPEEIRSLAWFEDGIVIELDDGTALVPMRDPEGNGPGAIHLHQEA